MDCCATSTIKTCKKLTIVFIDQPGHQADEEGQSNRSQDERAEPDAISSSGKRKAQNVLHSLILLACDEGPHQKECSLNETIARVLSVNMKIFDRVKKQFVENGLDAVTTRKPMSRVFSKKVDGDLDARLIALSCSPAPEGSTGWTLKMLANKAIELNDVNTIAPDAVRRALKNERQPVVKAWTGDSAETRR